MAGKKNLDDRQIRFLSYYLDPKSETYCNAYQSALRADYNERYAAQIVSLGTEWIQEATRRRERMLVKAERNLDEFLDSKNETIKASTSQFIAKTIGKKFYSEKSPLEDDEGKNVLAPLADSLKQLADKK